MGLYNLNNVLATSPPELKMNIEEIPGDISIKDFKSSLLDQFWKANPSALLITQISKTDSNDFKLWNYVDAIEEQLEPKCSSCGFNLDTREIFLLLFGDNLCHFEDITKNELIQNLVLINEQKCPICGNTQLTIKKNNKINKEEVDCIKLFDEGSKKYEEGKMMEAHEIFLKARQGFINMELEKEAADCDTSIGNVFFYLKQFKEAKKCYEQAKSVFNRLGFEREAAICDKNLGFVFDNIGEPELAKKHYERAKKVFLCQGFENELADCNQNILNHYIQNGILAKNTGQYKKAKEYFAEALKLSNEMGDEKTYGDILNNIGLVYSCIGQYEKALSYKKQSLEIQRKYKDLKNEAGTLLNIGADYSSLGQYNKALFFYEQALEIKRDIYDLKGEANCLNNIGFDYFLLGQYNKALSYCEEALKIQCTIGDLHGEGNTLGKSGKIYQAIGKYEDALNKYEEALNIRQKIGDVRNESAALGCIGSIYLDLGKYGDALKYNEESLKISRRIGDLKGVSGALDSIGTIYKECGNFTKAVKHYEEALEINKKIGDVHAEGICLQNLGIIFSNLEQHEEALSYYNKALKIQKEIGDLQGEGNTLNSIGATYADLGQHEKVLMNYEQALIIFQKIGAIKNEGTTLSNIGNFYIVQENYEKGLSYYEKALAIHRKVNDSRSEGTTLGNAGLAFLRSGKLQEAENYLESSASIFDSMRSHIKSDDERCGFQLTYMDVYSALAAVYIEQNKFGQAFETLERGRAKTFSDLLATRELKDRKSKIKIDQIEDLKRQLNALRIQQINLTSTSINDITSQSSELLESRIWEINQHCLELINELRQSDPERGSLLTVDPPGLREIQNLLSNDTTLIEYTHVGDYFVRGKNCNDLWIFVINSNSVYFHPVDVSISDLRITIEEYARQVSDKYSNLEEVYKVANILYNWLIKPIENLCTTKTVIIVPWESMFKIPFCGLISNDNNPFGLYKNLVMAPSAGVYQYLIKKRSSSRNTLFAVGNPRGDFPGAISEAEKIAELFENKIVKVGSDATKSLIKSDFSTLGSPDIIHFDCHGLFDEDFPEFSCLELAPEVDNNGRLEMHEIFDLNWKGVSLVTLSACSSGKGILGAGDDLIGLTRGFMFAGAPSVLCSLWNVDVKATRALMINFYENYISGMSKSDALRNAQKIIRKKENWTHPYYWSAFTLWGDWI